MSQYYQDLLIDALLEFGFTLDEAMRLIALHEQVERERRDELLRRQFLNWSDCWDVRSVLN